MLCVTSRSRRPITATATGTTTAGLALALTLVCATRATAEKRGYWGEDPARVPPFALTEERRAPKVPDGDKLFAGLAAPQTVDVLDSALLICQVSIDSGRAWDGVSGRNKVENLLTQYPGAPDLLLELRVGSAAPIRLHGPEDHWESYVSVPRLTLRRGETLAFRLWDRDVTGNESIGQAALRFDGRLPFTVSGRGFELRCRAMDAQSARSAAMQRLSRIDALLNEAERWRPDSRAAILEPHGGIDEITSDFGKNALRYAAGYLGWESPEIQERTARIAALRSRGDSAVPAMVAEIERSALPLGTVATVAGGRFLVRVEGPGCPPSWKPRPFAPPSCSLGFELRSARPERPLTCGDYRTLTMLNGLLVVDGNGQSYSFGFYPGAAEIPEAHDGDGRPACGPDDDKERAVAVLHVRRGVEQIGGRPRYLRVAPSEWPFRDARRSTPGSLDEVVYLKLTPEGEASSSPR